MSANCKVAGRGYSLGKPLENTALHRLIEVGEREIAAEHEIERPRRLLLPDVLLAKLNAGLPGNSQTVLLALVDERLVDPRLGQLPEAAAAIAGRSSNCVSRSVASTARAVCGKRERTRCVQSKLIV